jgi:triacylglycerol lipase
MMPVSLSPFRYLQLARYVLQRWRDQSSVSSWKGKARATPLRRATLVGAGQGVLRTSADEGRDRHSADLPPFDSPVAGPSRAPAGGPRRSLGPDPSLPSEPNEIYRLMNDERLFVRGAIKPPREVVVLCHGELRFCARVALRSHVRCRVVWFLHRLANTALSLAQAALLGVGA